MFLKLMEDLRFLIGALFSTIGMILVVHGLTSNLAVGDLNLNVIAGSWMLVFSAVMLGSVFWSILHEKKTEIAESLQHTAGDDSEADLITPRIHVPERRHESTPLSL